MQQAKISCAAMVIIGDEILSGRTEDKNIHHLASRLTEIGIDLKEVRVVSDEEDHIVGAVNDLRARFDWVFTSGGIGPTHDDITAVSIAKAFGVPIEIDSRAVAMMVERWGEEYLNETRLLMARIPKGAGLLPNSVSAAPGFFLGNVFVMAGVPKIMQAMLDEALKHVAPGLVIASETVSMAGLPESAYAAALAEIESLHAGVKFGSYPSITPGGTFDNRIVVRSRDKEGLQRGKAAVEALYLSMKAKYATIKPGGD